MVGRGACRPLIPAQAGISHRIAEGSQPGRARSRITSVMSGMIVGSPSGHSVVRLPLLGEGSTRSDRACTCIRKVGCDDAVGG